MRKTLRRNKQYLKLFSLVVRISKTTTLFVWIAFVFWKNGRGCSRLFAYKLKCDTMKGIKAYKGLDDYLKNVPENAPLDATSTNKETFNKVITVKVSEETFEAWEQLCENWGDVLGYDNKSKIMEFAIVEALNVPIASLGGFTM